MQVSRGNPGASLLLNVSYRRVNKQIVACLRICSHTNKHREVASFLYFILINVQSVF